MMRTMLEDSIECLKQLEPEEGYFVAFSGGKDSQCVYHLCKMAGVKFDAHFSLTSVDPPEVVQFIKQHYPDVIFDIPYDRNGNRVTMWSLIPERKMPPTRIVRYCCEELKEIQGNGRRVVTGVRKAESTFRKKNQGNITIIKANKKTLKEMEEMGANFTQTNRGGVVLNYDNSETKRVLETCLVKHRMLVNPIIDWSDGDVWEFLNGNGIPHCCLYDQGMERIGCIGCPMQGAEGIESDFKRWPSYRKLYMKAFDKMLEARRNNGLQTDWETAEEVMQWWIGQ